VGVYKRNKKKKDANYYYEFQFRGKKYTGCTHTHIKRDAEKKEKEIKDTLLAELLGLDENGDVLNDGRKLLSVAVRIVDEEDWKHDKDRQKTLDRAQTIIDLLNDPFIDDITADTVEDLRAALLGLHKERGYKDEMSPATQNRYMAILKKVLRRMVEKRHLEYVPFIKIHEEKTKKKRRIQTVPEQQEIADWLMQNDPQLHDLWRVMLLLIRRPSELLKLEKRSVDLVKKQIWLWDTKAGRTMPFPLPEEAVEIITRRVAVLKKPTERLFTYSIWSVDRRWQKLRRELGLSGDRTFVFYSTRHTAVTDHLEGGLSTSIVKDLAGHATITTTDIYTHLTTNGKKRAVEHMDEYRRQNRNIDSVTER